MKRTIFLIALFCAPATLAIAEENSVEKTCPIDGKVFEYRLPPESTSRGLYLDMKPVEPGKSSWPLPKCPGNGFVLYKDRFSESKIRKFRQFVLSEPYRSMVDGHPTHYLAAVLMRRVEEPLYDIAWFLVRASWEAGTDAARYRQYAKEALDAYEALPEGMNLPRRQRIVREMISGELERRLGLFEAANKRFRGIRDEAEFTTPILQRVIQLQLKLIGAKDSGVHRMPN